MSDGMVAGVTLIPEEELGIVVLANRHESNVVRPVTLILLDHFTGFDETTDWDQIYLDLEGGESIQDGDLPAKSSSPARPARDLIRYAGTYHNPAIGNASVTIIADPLRIDFAHTPLYSGTLEHLDADRFLAHRDYPLVDPSPIIFRIDGHSGLATGFIVSPDGTEWLASFEYQFEKIVDQAP